MASGLAARGRSEDMGQAVTQRAALDEQEADAPPVVPCIGCGRPLATVLEQLGSLRCHDCRDGEVADSLGTGAPGR
jgi:hypothetical protein